MKNITLVVQETQYHTLAARAVEETLKHIEVDEVLTFSNQPIVAGERLIKIEHFPSVEAYCQFMLTGMLEHLTTDHLLFVQWDAMAYDQTKWTDEFLNYDYIGAPWPWYGDLSCVGNGGFSLRSRRLLEALQDPKIKMIPNDDTAMHEDRAIGLRYRPYLESEYNIRYPRREVAAQFSYELGPFQNSFGFHGIWNIIRLADDKIADFYIENMNYQGWNHYKWHHVLFEIGRLNNSVYFDYVLDKMQKHSPDLVESVLNWLSREDFNQDIY